MTRKQDKGVTMESVLKETIVCYIRKERENGEKERGNSLYGEITEGEKKKLQKR